MNSLSDGCNFRYVSTRLISPQVDKRTLAWFVRGEFRGGCLSSRGLSSFEFSCENAHVLYHFGRLSTWILKTHFLENRSQGGRCFVTK